MRPQFVFALLLFTFLLFGAALFIKRQMGGEPAPLTNSATEVSVPSVDTNVVEPVVVSPQPAPALIPVAAAPVSVATNATVSAVAPTNTLTDEEREAEIERLQDLQMKDDAGSLSNIVADLTSPDKEIREAAIEATKEFGSADAIPSLKAAAASADDVEDQIAYLEAAEFLSLPSIDFSGTATPPTPEQIQLEQRKAAALLARHQAQVQAQTPQNAPEQNPPDNSNQ